MDFFLDRKNLQDKRHFMFPVSNERNHDFAHLHFEVSMSMSPLKYIDGVCARHFGTHRTKCIVVSTCSGD